MVKLFKTYLNYTNEYYFYGMQVEDSIILAKFRNEKTRNEAFNLLLKNYQQRVYWHIRRMVIDHDDANDLTQDVFIKIWGSLERFREEAKLYTWIYRIASNECITFLNKKKLRSALSLENYAEVLEDKLGRNADPSAEKIEHKLQQALLQLPQKQKLVFNMKYYEDMTYEEMSAVLGTSVGALKASYHHAVKKIEAFLTTD